MYVPADAVGQAGAAVQSREGQETRLYQTRAENGIFEHWRAGQRRVLCVLPTGGGKTHVADNVVQQLGVPTLWIAHRRELLKQAAEKLRALFGRFAVGVIAPGFDYEPYARIQVGTVQTLIARDKRPEAGLIVFDEAHHFLADSWFKLASAYPNAYCLGLTATPERQDGTPLGDLFDSLVVAASYSELLTDGYLVPCRVYQPPEALRDGVAQDPLEAWKRYADGARTFFFVSSVERAQSEAARFTAAGVPSEVVTAKTPRRDRDAALERFRAGTTRVLVNVGVFTEGTDVPEARCVLLARRCEHVGLFLQIAGRVLRPAPGKPDAVLIDLTGATLVHGLPTEDRVYSLEGDGIRREGVVALRNCLKCGATLPASQRVCPECGYEHVPAPPKPVRIYSLELREVYAGAGTPGTAKEREYKRLRELARAKGWSLGWVVKAYRTLFSEAPNMGDVGMDERKEEFDRLKTLAAQKNYKPGFAKVRYRDMFDTWPPRSW